MLQVLKPLRDRAPLATIRHFSSSPHLTEVKASSETQDVKAMDTLLKVVRKSFATVSEFTSC